MVIEKGKECGWNTETRRIYHYKCKEREESQPDAEQHALADKLGYRTPADWDLLLLPASANGDPAWWNRSTTRGRDEVRGVPTSDEIERITAVRGSQPY